MPCPHQIDRHLARTMLTSRLLALTFCATPLAAQFDYDLEKRTAGRLGDDLELEIVGAPANAFVLLLPSATSGPTPLALIDPLDLRALSVGIDMLGALTITTTDANGDAPYALPLPTTPSLAGIALHWQSLSLAFGSTLFGELSNDVVTQVGQPDTGVLAPTSLLAPRAFAAALLDEDNDNSHSDVLLTGGGSGTLTSATGLASTEFWSFRRMQPVTGPAMATARVLHTAVRLNDGRVLLAGGADGVGAVLSSCEVYDPTTNSFAATGSMGTPRILHGATLLADGRVMVAGGTATLTPDITAAVTNTLASAEIWNPATGLWTPTANIGGRRLAPALTRLSNNKVMVSGGVQIGFVFGIPISAVSTTAVQLWDPANGQWSSGANMSQGRAGHHFNQVTLNDGRVLMTGGVNVPSLLGAANATSIAGAELYNPLNNSWQSVPMATARTLHSATVLGDGRVAVCGGAQGTLTAPTSLSSVELFDPSSNTWSAAPTLTAPRASHAAVLLQDGTLALFGGQDANATTATVETVRF